MALAGDVCFGGFALGIQAVELGVQVLVRAPPGLDGTANALNCRLLGIWLPPHRPFPLALLCGSPKKARPFQWVPVMA